MERDYGRRYNSAMRNTKIWPKILKSQDIWCIFGHFQH